MPKLVLVSTLERGAVPRNSSFSRFGFLFTVGWQKDQVSDANPGAGAPNSAFGLFPWTWSPLTKIQLAKKTNGVWSYILDGTATPRPKLYNLASAAPGFASLKVELRRRYLESSTKVDWHAPGSLATPTRVQVSSKSADPYYWHAAIKELATAPHPIPQSLNLSFYFDVPNADLGNYEEIAAFPVLRRSLNGSDSMTLGSPIQNQATCYQQYADTGLTYEVWSETKPLPRAISSPSPNFDPTTLGVKLTDVFTQDWQANLRNQAPKLFSLPAFIEYLVQRADAPESLRKNLLSVLAEAGIAALRDLAGPGTEAGPDGYSFLRSRKLDPPPGYRASFQNLFPLQGDWKAFLKEHFKLAQLPILDISSTAVTVSQSGKETSGVDLILQLQKLNGWLGESSAASGHSKLYFNQWARLLGNPRSNVFLDRLREELKPLEESTGVASPFPHAWLDDLAGYYWPFILSRLSTGTMSLLEVVKEFSKYHLLLRLGMAPAEIQGLPNPRWRQAPSDWNKNLPEWLGLNSYFRSTIDEWHKEFTRVIGQDATIKSLQQTAHPVYLQFATPDAYEPDSANDLFTKFRGVGVLMRDAASSTGEWHSLNRNDLVDGNGDSLSSTNTPFGLSVRPSFRETRNCLLPYNNEPLAGGSPLDLDDRFSDAVKSDGSELARNPLITASPNVTVKIPALKFGRKFEFACFAALNSGLLPPIAAATGDPREWAGTVPSSARSPILAAAKTHIYQRLTPVGAIRVFNDESQPREFQSLPVIEKSVHPRAEDLNWRSLFSSLPSGQKMDDPDARLPLVLVCPWTWQSSQNLSRSSYRFKVALPQTNWQLWDRWSLSLTVRNPTYMPSAWPKATADQRKVVIDTCRNAADSGKPADVIDDPALAGILHVQLFVESDGVLLPASETFVKLPNSSGRSALEAYRRPPLTIEIKHLPTSRDYRRLDSRFVVVQGPTLEVHLAEGQVGLLRVSACVPAKFLAPAAGGDNPMLDSRLVGRKVTDTLDVSGLGVEDYHLVSTLSYILESATDLLPSRKELFDRFSLGFRKATKTGSQTSVEAEFTPPANPQGNALSLNPFLYCGEALVNRQCWRWFGRPVPLHPALDPKTTSTTLGSLVSDWTTEVYCEYPDLPEIGDNFSMAVVPRKQDPAAWTQLEKRGARAFQHTESISTRNEDGSETDERGLHFRYALKVSSRYGALMRSVRGVSSSSEAASVPQWKGLAFKDVLLPSRPTRRPPAPKLRFVLPLTESSLSDSPSSPGWLAVFDEVWYEQAGIGEDLIAELVMTPVQPLTKSGGEIQKYRVEFGPDPIITKLDATVLPEFTDRKNPPASFTEPSLAQSGWTGPVAHFRDERSTSARFLATSFQIPAPITSAKIPPSQLHWWMASIRFQRRVRTKQLPSSGTQAGDFYLEKQLLDYPSETLTSPFTDPYWVQLLPPFSIFQSGNTWRSIASLRFQLNARQRSLFLYDPENLKAPLDPIPLDTSHFDPLPGSNPPSPFRLYAVLTALAFDFRGRQNQEIYLATFSQQPDKKTWTTDTNLSDLDPNGRYRIRLLEIQLPTAAPSGRVWPQQPSKIWDSLFDSSRLEMADVSQGGKSQLDGLGRIVRYSEPADNAPIQACEIKEGN